MLRVDPGLHLADRDEAGLDQIIGRRGVVADGNDALHTLGDGDGIHASNSTQGVSQGWPGSHRRSRKIFEAASTSDAIFLPAMATAGSTALWGRPIRRALLGSRVGRS